MARQPNPILASSLPGLAVGDWENPSGPDTGPWRPLALANVGLDNGGGGYPPARWMLDSAGCVRLSGFLQSGAGGGVPANTVLFTLPIQPLYFISLGVSPPISGVTRLYLVPQGAKLDGAFPNSAYLTLDGLFYPVA